MTEARASAPARVRSRALSPRAFHRLSVLALASLVAIILTGTAVRLTGSGLGCANWPRCGETFLPPQDYHALIEFGNRAVSIPVGFLTLATAVGAWLVPGLPRWTRWTALSVLLLVLVEAWLGGVTVRSDLDPHVVIAHFLLALVALAAAAVVVVAARNLAEATAGETIPSSLRLVAAALVPVGFAVVVTGTLVTAAGPHPGGENIVRIGNLVDAAYVHVRATAIFGVGFLVLLGLLFRHAGRARAELALALGVLALLLTQMAVGEIQWRNRLPWWLVLVHVALATLVWTGLVTLAARLWLRARGFGGAAGARHAPT